MGEFFAGQNFAGALEERGEELKRLLGQADLCSVPAELSGPEVEFEQAEANHVLGRRNRHSTPPVPVRWSLAPVLYRDFAWSEGFVAGTKSSKPLILMRLDGEKQIALGALR